MAVWPATLPQTIPLPASEQRQEGFIRTRMEAGPFKQRKRFTAVSRFIQVRDMLLDDTQRQTFDSFYATTLGEGGDSFDWSDPIDGSTVTCRFTSAPSYQAVAGGGASGGAALWRVSFDLEILP